MPPEDIDVPLSVIEVKTDPFGFHRYASEFLRAAYAFPYEKGFSPVPYYLFCRSLELVLKAYALAKGDTVDALKKQIGHNLEKALERATELGLGALVSLSEQEKTELAKANHYYYNKGFEYFELSPALAGYPDLPDIPDLPDLNVLKAVAERLMVATKHECRSC